MLRRLVRDARNLPFVFALLFALLIVPEIPSPVVRPTAGWRGRYVLLHREDAGPAVAEALAAIEPGAVSRSTATVKIDAFAEIEPVRVDALAARLDPLDPRRDAWIDGVEGLFRARRGDEALAAAYLPATRGRIAAWLLLDRALRAAGARRESWQLLELEPAPALAAAFAALAFAFAAAGRLPRARRGIMVLAALGVLVWVPGLLNGGPGMLWPCSAALFLWIPRAAIPAPAASQATAARIGAILIVSLAALVPDDAVLYRAGRMLASLLCLELLAAMPLEALVPMPPRVRRWHPAGAPIAAFAAAVILVALPPALSRLRVPLPRVVSLAAGDGPAGLSAAASRRNGDGQTAPSDVPGLPEAVAHAWMLQAAPFVPIGSRDGSDGFAHPADEVRIVLREYRFAADGSAVVEAPLTVVRFDPGWLDRLSKSFPGGSSERLLLEQGRAVRVRARPPWISLLRSLPAALALLVLLALPLAVPAARRHLIRLGLSGITEPASRRRTR